MSKKISFLSVVILVLTMFAACAQAESDCIFPEVTLICESADYISEHPPLSIEGSSCDFDDNDDKEIIEIGSNFRIFKTSDLLPWYTHFEVFNCSGEIVSSFTTSRPAWIKHLSENVLEIGVSVGVGTRQVKFYSIRDDVFSEFFFSPFHIKDEIIAEMRLYEDDYWVLVIQDIFDPSTLYKRFFIEDLPHTESPFFAIASVAYAGNDRIVVTHLTDDNYAERCVILCFR